jgi:hypothetical protein
MLGAALLAVGCWHGTRHYGAIAPASRDPITRAELDGTGIADVYEAVRILRPRWLRPRMATGANDGLPLVYVQRMRYGSIRELRRFRVAGIKEIRYVDARSATTRWGMGHSNGVIEVIELTQHSRGMPQE